MLTASSCSPLRQVPVLRRDR